jgi:hypothetical protein
MYGFHPHLDNLFVPPSHSSPFHIQNHVEHLQLVHEKLCHSFHLAQLTSESSTNKYHSPHTPFQLGDKVLVSTKNLLIKGP